MSLNNVAVTAGGPPFGYELTDRDDQQPTRPTFSEARAKNVNSTCQTLGATLGAAVGGILGAGAGVTAGYFLTGIMMPATANDIQPTTTSDGKNNQTVIPDSLGQCQMREFAEIGMGAGSTLGCWIGGTLGAAIGSCISSKC